MKFNTNLVIKIIFLFIPMHLLFLIWLHLDGLSIGKIINSLLLLTSVLLLIIFSFKIFMKEGKKLNVLFYPYTLLILWSFFTIFRSISSDFHDVIVLLGNYLLGAGAWLTPLILLFGYRISILKDFFTVVTFIQIVAILIIPFYFINSPSFATAALFSLFAFVPLYIFLFPLLKYKYKIIVLGYISSYIIAAVMYSSRTVILVLILSLFFSLFEYTRNSTYNIYKKIIVLLALLAMSIILMFNIDQYINDASNDKDLTADSRTFLMVELFGDMSIKEQIIGRGALGTYFSPTFAHLNRLGIHIDSSNRGSVEVGYLNLLLKGGYIMIILYLIILLPSIFLGIFRANNLIVKALGYYVLLIVLLMSVNYPQAFNPANLLLWLASGIILNRTARNLTNEQIIEYIYPDRYNSIFK